MLKTSILLLALSASLASAQSLGARVAAVRDGTVRLEYAAAEGVCGNGRGNVSIRSDGRSTSITSSGTTRGREWEDECEPGPVRLAVDMASGRITDLRTYVGGRWRGTADADLGTVSAAEASAWLLDLARTETESVAKDAIFAATIADVPTPWRELLAIAKDSARPRGVRSGATFWVAQAAGDAATAGLVEVAENADDREVRKSALFALSQQRGGESVTALIRVARTNRDPELRKTAIFWLGQSRDPRALAYFEEVLTR